MSRSLSTFAEEPRNAVRRCDLVVMLELYRFDLLWIFCTTSWSSSRGRNINASANCFYYVKLYKKSTINLQ